MKNCNHWWRRRGAISAVVVSSLLLGVSAQAASGSTGSAKPNPASVHGTITVYAALTTFGGNGFVGAFEHEYPNVQVNMVTGGTGKLVPELLAQQKANDVQADVVLLADPASMGILNGAHVLSNWRPSLRGRQVPAGYEGNGWVGAFSFQNVIVYKSGLANPPTKWTDLLKPALKGEVAIGSAGYSGTTFGWAAELASKYGWSYFHTLKANGARVEKSTTTTGTDVADGRTDAAVTLDSVARSLLKAGAGIKIAWPSDGAVICPAPVGVTAAGMKSEQQASEAFVTWMLSHQGQAAAAHLYYDPAYYAAKPIDPVPSSASILYPNWNKIGKQKLTAVAKFNSIFG